MLRKIENICAFVVHVTGIPVVLIAIVALSLLEMVFGQFSHADPYPFQFLSTCCNVVGIWMLFILAVGANANQRDHIDIHRAHHDQTRQHIDRHMHALGKSINPLRADDVIERIVLSVDRNIRASMSETHVDIVKRIKEDGEATRTAIKELCRILAGWRINTIEPSIPATPPKNVTPRKALTTRKNSARKTPRKKAA